MQGSAHQIHHYALLFGMGADAVCPYMCYYALFKARDDGRLGMNYTNTELVDRVKSAFDYGVRKVMAKMVCVCVCVCVFVCVCACVCVCVLVNTHFPIAISSLFIVTRRI